MFEEIDREQALQKVLDETIEHLENHFQNVVVIAETQVPGTTEVLSTYSYSGGLWACYGLIIMAAARMKKNDLHNQEEDV